MAFYEFNKWNSEIKLGLIKDIYQICIKYRISALRFMQDDHSEVLIILLKIYFPNIASQISKHSSGLDFIGILWSLWAEESDMPRVMVSFRMTRKVIGWTYLRKPWSVIWWPPWCSIFQRCHLFIILMDFSPDWLSTSNSSIP